MKLKMVEVLSSYYALVDTVWSQNIPFLIHEEVEKLLGLLI